jgi:hypothetical protein
MGTITRSFANNITTSGVLLPASLTNNSIANVTAYNASIATGNMVLLSSQTASNSASISFTTNISSTYKEYQFYFINIHPRTDNVSFTFQGSTNGGSSYGIAITSTSFTTWNNEGGAYDFLGYRTGTDSAQSTNYHPLTETTSSDADHALVATLSLFNPASTTYAKQFISNCQQTYPLDDSLQTFIGGYFNTTSAINAVQFKMDSGNFDGDILMYGIV